MKKYPRPRRRVPFGMSAAMPLNLVVTCAGYGLPWPSGNTLEVDDMFIFCGHCSSSGVIPVYVNSQQWGKTCPHCAEKRAQAQQRDAEPVPALCARCGECPAAIEGFCWDCRFDVE